jgi:hypothetical protein
VLALLYDPYKSGQLVLPYPELLNKDSVLSGSSSCWMEIYLWVEEFYEKGVLTAEDMKQYGLHGLVESFFSWENLRNGLHPLQETISFRYTDLKKPNREGG